MKNGNNGFNLMNDLSFHSNRIEFDKREINDWIWMVYVWHVRAKRVIDTFVRFFLLSSNVTKRWTIGISRFYVNPFYVKNIYAPSFLRCVSSSLACDKFNFVFDCSLAIFVSVCFNPKEMTRKLFAYSEYQLLQSCVNRLSSFHSHKWHSILQYRQWQRDHIIVIHRRLRWRYYFTLLLFCFFGSISIFGDCEGFVRIILPKLCGFISVGMCSLCAFCFN